MILNTVNAIYTAEIEADKASQRERKVHHYPSSACAYNTFGKFCGSCRRATYYSLTGQEKTNPMDAPALFKTNVGNVIHDHLSSLLEKYLIEKYDIMMEGADALGFGHEVPFEWNPPLLHLPFSGRMDGRYKMPDGKVLGVEWKSIYGRGADMVKENGPKEDAIMQCLIYLKQDVIPVDEIALMYVCRDSGYFLGYSIRFDENQNGDDVPLIIEEMSTGRAWLSEIKWSGLLRATLELEANYLGQQTPSKDYGSQNPDKDNKWRCNYCSYADHCKGE